MPHHSLIRLFVLGLCAVSLTACTGASSMLAGSAKGFCKHNPGSGPCSSAPAGYQSGAPPK